MNTYSRYELLLVIFFFGLSIGGVIASSIWYSKCQAYEREVIEYNKHV